MSFDLNIVQKGVLRTAYAKSVDRPLDTFLQDVLFGGTPIYGDGQNGVIQYQFRRRGTIISDEAVFGLDPNRVNYKTSFDEKYLKPSYMNDIDSVNWYDVQNRVFGEYVEQPKSAEARAIIIASEKRNFLIDSQRMYIEKMCADMLFNGKVTLKQGGEQAMPITSDFLAISGASLYKTPVKVILDAVAAMRKRNAGISGATALIMNVDDAYLLTTSSAMEKLLNKDSYDLANVTYSSFTENGLMFFGSFFAGGKVEIYGYAGTYATSDSGTVTLTNYIPRGKAVLLTNVGKAIGSMGWGAVMAADGDQPSLPKVLPSRTTVYLSGEGDNKVLKIQQQCSPLPVVTAIDGYGILTGIPSSLS